jgi:hypothetical protein
MTTKGKLVIKRLNGLSLMLDMYMLPDYAHNLSKVLLEVNLKD